MMTKFFKKLIIAGLILFCGLIPNALRSQYAYSQHYTIKEGLPSSSVYDILQDDHSYIWFATENGVSRFDGTQFNNYNVQDGLPSNSVIKMLKDHMGRIWFVGYDKQLSYFDNGKFYHYQFNHVLDRIIPSPRLLYNFHVDKSGYVYLVTIYGGIIALGPDGSCSIFRRNHDPKNIEVNIYQYHTRDGSIIYGLDNYLHTGDKDMAIEFPDSSNIRFTLPQQKDPVVNINYLTINDSISLFSFGNQLFKVKNEEIISTFNFNGQVTGLFLYDAARIWVSVLYRGAHLFDVEHFSCLNTHLFSENTVTNVFKDREENLWFSTEKQGVFIIPSFDFRSLESDTENGNKAITALDVNKNQLVFSNIDAEIFTIEKQHSEYITKRILSVSGPKAKNYDLLITSDTLLWIPALREIFDLKNNQLTSVVEPLHINSFEGYDLLELSNGNVAVSISADVKVLKKEKTHYVFSHYLNIPGKVFALHQTDDGIIWCGTMDGLLWYKDGNLVKCQEGRGVLDGRITKISSRHQDVWVGTFDQGIAVFKPDSILYIDQENGLGNNRINAFHIENDSCVWVGTIGGLSRITFDAAGGFQIRNYNIWDGLPSDEIFDIIKFDGEIWLGTGEGLAYFNPEDLKEKNAIPVLNIEQIEINNTAMAIDSFPLELDYGKNNFLFGFKGISFRNPEKIKYYYYLEGLENNWIETENTSVRYSEIPPGEYSFHVKAIISDLVYSQPVKIDFNIKKPFHHTLLFTVLVFLIFFILIFFVVSMVLKDQKKRNERKRQLLIAELKALRSQMNPHFIFNSLNSIQDFILSQDTKNAIYYLASFATLIRKILECTKKNLNSLEDEIEILKLYLEIEKLRFGKRFTYKINIEEGLNTGNINFPSMIVQPFVENAIWHGLMPLKEPGKLDITFSTRDRLLFVKIVDNGIGRKMAEQIKIKRNGYQSMGLQNIQDRIKLTKALNRTELSYQIIDRVDENDKATGTTVIITLKL